MSQVLPRLASITLIGFLLGSGWSAAPARGAILTRQDFEGNFTLTDASPLLEDAVPDSSDYSGFVVYEEEGTLLDWELDVNELNLNLDPSSTLGDGLNPLTPTVTFELFSLTDWDLEIDFGIAFDAPRYTLERMSDSITLQGELGLAGTFVYTDTAAEIAVTQIPEPTTILGTLVASGAVVWLRKRRRS